MGWIRRSSRRDRRIDAVLLPAAGRLFGKGVKIPPLWGGALFREVAERTGLEEAEISDRARRLKLWGGYPAVARAVEERDRARKAGRWEEMRDGLAGVRVVCLMGRDRGSGGLHDEDATLAAALGVDRNRA